MKYQIDQSGKIEQTAKSTYIALANGKTKILKISSVEKRKLLKTVRELNRPHSTYIYHIFAILVFFLIKDEGLDQVFIDQEYFGHGASIKETLLQLFEQSLLLPPLIRFELVGKKSSAHHAAIEAFQKKRSVDITIKAKDVLSTKKGWRPRSGRGNP